MDARLWTQEQSTAAIELRKRGNSFREIARQLERTVVAVETHLRRNAPHLFGSEPRKKARRRPSPRQTPWIFNRVDIAVRPDPIAMAERDYRLALPPRDLTAAIFGDPKPGFSALDRR